MDKGGRPRFGCKWHPKKQGEGICAQCLRGALRKLVEYQGEYQESLDLPSETFTSNSLTDFTQQKGSIPYFPSTNFRSLSYKSCSRRESELGSRSRGGGDQEEASTSGAKDGGKKQRESSRSKSKLSWGTAVYRIGLIKNAFGMLWRSEKKSDASEERRKERNFNASEDQSRVFGQNFTAEEPRERGYSINGWGERAHIQKSVLVSHDADEVDNKDGRRATGSRVSPWGGSSFSLSKFHYRSGDSDATRPTWRRSKSSREPKRESNGARLDVGADVEFTRMQSRRNAYTVVEPVQRAPHPSTKASPWRFFSRSNSRKSPGRLLKPSERDLPNDDVILDTKHSTASGSKSNPHSRGQSPHPNILISTSKSAVSSPSMAKLESRTQFSQSSKSTPWSSTLSPSSSKLSPLYLLTRPKERNGESFVADVDSRTGVYFDSGTR